MFAQVRFKLVLPIVMVFLSGVLMLIAKEQYHSYVHWSMGRDEPARILNEWLNGPGYVLPILLPTVRISFLDDIFYYDEPRLLGVALEWFLIGGAIDRRRRNAKWFAKRPKLRLTLFALAALVSAGFSVAYIFLAWNERQLLHDLFVNGLLFHTSRGGLLGFSLWCDLSFAYFARKSLLAFFALSSRP